MKLFNRDGKEFTVELKASSAPMRSKVRCKSNIQYEVGQELRKMYPRQVILEEFSVPGERFFLDFFLPQIRLVVEVDGKQHSEFSPFFHGTREKFVHAQKKDSDKEEWCEINSISIARTTSVEGTGEAIKKALRS